MNPKEISDTESLASSEDASKAPKPFRSIVGRIQGGRLPTDAEWNAMKKELADDIEKSTERLARQIKGDFSEER